MLAINHIILVMGWVLFGVFHSLLAATWWKRFMQRRLGSYFKYYPFSYSVFAAVTLIAIIVYQVTLPSDWLYVAPGWVKLLLCLPLLAGVGIMGALIKKYFFALSGISVFFAKQPPEELELGGLNRYLRHPLYSGTLLTLWSLFFIFPQVKNLLACVVITGYTIWGARLEEKKLLARFGEQYRIYKSQVPMLLPRFTGRAT